MQRRIEQTDRDGQALHDLEQFDEVGALHRQKLCKRRAAGLFVFGDDHLADGADARFLEEHVLGAAQADAFGAELERGARIRRGIGIGADLEFAELIGPTHQRAELAGQFRLDHRHLTGQHLTERAVDGDDIARLEGAVADRHRAATVIDADAARAGNTRLAHAARHNGSVRGHAAARGEDALGGVHAVNVFRRRFDAHQHDLAAIGMQLGSFIRGEHDLTGRSAGRGRKARRHHIALGIGIDGRVQQLIERSRLDAGHRILLRDQAFVGELDRDAQRSLGSALAVTGLQHPQLALLDREFHVLHVTVVLFELLIDARQLREGIRHFGFHRRLVRTRFLAGGFSDFLRRADAGDDVLALRVDEEFAVQLALAGRGIARERNAGRRGLAHVAEYHRLHVDRGTPRLRNIVQAAIRHGARRHPRTEHRANRAPELLVRILREIVAGLARDHLLVTSDNDLPVVGVEIGVERIALAVLVGVQHILEVMMLEAEHHIRVHGDEAAIAVIGKAAVVRIRSQRLDRGVVEAKVEDSVHHARHRGPRARAHRDQKRVLGIAELLADNLADGFQRLFDLRLQLLRIAFVVGVEVGADRGRDGEAGRYRKTEIGHLGEIGTLAAEQLTHARLTFGLAVAEQINPFSGFCGGLGVRRALGGRGFQGLVQSLGRALRGLGFCSRLFGGRSRRCLSDFLTRRRRCRALY
ncbi:hypothetical protein BN961_02312 [Afipia felis]|uniref:NAD-specific glutamate dehydrogenase n=1 Tax=Afipia felis TaxID=1035 RepID=A0A090MRT3_AFIFE|nr:hypothetical protein BN961_02312 [Afipia felis]